MKAMILSVCANGAIGYKNDLVWKNSEDLKRFKSITTNQTIIMGRRTMESLPKFPLPNRKNIVISSKKNLENSLEFSESPNEIFIMSFEESLKLDSYIVIGGATLYEQYLPYIDTIYITHVMEYPMADTFFKPLDWSWKCVENIECSGFYFQTWKKI